MQIQRISSLLQGIASARGWLIKHIPLTSSMAGCDLFLKVDNDCARGLPSRARSTAMRCASWKSRCCSTSLGNLRRGYRRDFPWAIACELRRQDPMMAGLAMPTGETVNWKNGRQSPGSEAELARYVPHFDPLYAQYASYFR